MKKWTFVQKLRASNRITVPEPVREFLGIRPGDLLKVTIERAPEEGG